MNRIVDIGQTQTLFLWNLTSANFRIWITPSDLPSKMNQEIEKMESREST